MYSDHEATQTLLITGCNRGLGLQLVKMLILKNPDVKVIATVRSKKEELKKKFDEDFPKNNVQVMELDITNKQSILNLVGHLTIMNTKLDALVNNSAVLISKEPVDFKKLLDPNEEKQLPSPEQAHKTFTVNYYGTIALTKAILPLLKDNGRIINVSSGLSALKFQSKKIQDIFQNHQLTQEIIDYQISRFINGCQTKNLDDFFPLTYGTSKMILNAWSRFILSKMLKPTQTAISMSPGHCRTDMGGPTGNRSAEDGALSIYLLIWGQYSNQVFYHVISTCDYQNCGMD